MRADVMSLSETFLRPTLAANAESESDASPPDASRAKAIQVASLVEAARGGEAEAFTALYHSFGAMVHGVLLANAPVQEVDDLVQEVFARAFVQLKTLREPAAFGAWLACIARNTATDFHRRTPATEQLDEAMMSGARQTDDAEAEEVLRRLQRLPEAFRMTLILRLVEGMTAREIAAQTRMTEGSVRVNLHRGIKLLRAELAKGEKG